MMGSEQEREGEGRHSSRAPSRESLESNGKQKRRNVIWDSRLNLQFNYLSCFHCCFHPNIIMILISIGKTISFETSSNFFHHQTICIAGCFGGGVHTLLQNTFFSPHLLLLHYRYHLIDIDSYYYLFLRFSFYIHLMSLCRSFTNWSAVACCHLTQFLT